MNCYFNFSPILVEDVEKHGFIVDGNVLRYGNDSAIVDIKYGEDNVKYIGNIAKDNGTNCMAVIKKLCELFDLLLVDDSSEEFYNLMHSDNNYEPYKDKFVSAVEKTKRDIFG